MHIQGKQRRLHGKELSELGAQYRGLDEEQRRMYEEMGQAATSAASLQGQSFPSFSATAARKRSHGSKPVVSEKRPQGLEHCTTMAEKLKLMKSANKQEKKERSAKHVEECAAVLANGLATEEIMQRQWRLLIDPDVQFFRYPFIGHCQAFTLSNDMSKCKNYLTNLPSISQLQEEWVETHVTLDPLATSIPKAIPMTRCRFVSECCCDNVRSRHIAAVTKTIKQLLKDNALENALCQGEIIIEWRSSPEVKEENAMQDTSASLWTFVPLHYQRPWRPVLLQLKLLEMNDDSNMAEFEVQGSGEESYTVLELWLKQLDVLSALWMRFWTLTCKAEPCRPISGQAYAEPTSVQAWSWKGPSDAAGAKRRAQKRKAASSTTTSALASLDAQAQQPNPDDEPDENHDITEEWDQLEEMDLRLQCGEDDGAGLSLAQGFFQDVNVTSDEDDSDVIAELEPTATSSISVPMQAQANSNAQPEAARSSDHDAGADAPPSSSSSDSSTSSTPAARRRAKSQERDEEFAEMGGLRAYTLMHKFRITPKAPASQGGSGGQYGGFSCVCPFHRKTPQTMCKKWSGLEGPTNLHKKHALTRLIVWLLDAKRHNRQRDHVSCALQRDVSGVDVKALHSQVHAFTLPEGRVKDDRTLDSEEGVDPDLAPKRAAAARRRQ